jgi:hypothetical protein
VRALPFVLVAILVSAGCLGGSKDPAPSPDAVGATSAGKANATAAPVDDGSKKAVADTAHMPHMHDYWKGKERVTVFDGDLAPDAMNTTFATIFQSVFGQRVAAGGMLWNLPDGQIVYEGTGKMQLTASWTDPRVTGVGFIYRSAESPDYKDGASLPNGKTVDLPITPAMTDMPHAKISKWQFGFGPDQSPGALAGPFHLRLDLVRVNDIMLFPAHPDFWHGNHSLLLLDGDHHGQADSYVKRIAQPATQGGQFTEDWVSFPRPVPMEAKGVRFVVTIKSATSTPGKVDAFGLFYHGADTTNPYRCPILPLNATLPATLTWEVPASEEMSDSPYAPASQWQFFVEPQAIAADGTPEMGGMTDVSYDYHVVSTAFDGAFEKPMQCAQDQQGG